MSSNLKVNTILPSTGDTVSIAGIASITSSVSIASSCTATTFFGSGGNITYDGTTLNIIDSGGGSGSHRLTIGNSHDLRLYHDGNTNIGHYGAGDFYLTSNSGTDLYVRSADDIFLQPQDGESGISIIGDGAVELYHNNVKQAETMSNGFSVGNQLSVGESVINLEKAGVHHHRIVGNDTGNDLGFQQSSDTGSNTNFTTYLRINDGGNISLPVDNQQLRLGASGDLILMHENDHSYVQAYNVGNMYLGCIHNGDVIVRQNSQNRYQFAAGGFNPLTDNVYDLGNSSYRWRNLYTGDINLSNKGSQNDVDGTWGDYTIQEGDSDLYLINKRSGKKFKFMLQEVS